MKIKIAKAKPEQAGQLSQLAMRSKGHWGYSPAFLQAVTGELTYMNEQVAEQPTFIATLGGKTVGFYLLAEIDANNVELEALFVEPDFIGQGVGKELFFHATKEAKRLQYQAIKIQSDPYAADFYQKRGCEAIGHMESLSVPGRRLPLFQYKL